MRHAARTIGIGAALATLALATPSATNAASEESLRDCQGAIVAKHRVFASDLLELEQRCRAAELRNPGTCPRSLTPGPVANTLRGLRLRLVAALRSGLARSCNVGRADLTDLFFPGRCPDLDPTDGFTVADLTDCIRTVTETTIGGACTGGANRGEACMVLADCADTGPGTRCQSLLATAYDAALIGPLERLPRRCVETVATHSRRYLVAILRAAEACRRRLIGCRSSSDCSAYRASQCLVADAETVDRVGRARARALGAITSACTDTDVLSLRLCDPDQPSTPTMAACVLDASERAAEAFIAIDLPDPPEPRRCGDDVVDPPTEECDGTEDRACPGNCGAADGFFPCLCQDRPRLRVVVAGDVDLDLGWMGRGHDANVGRGGGYLADLWDCDGPGGPDTVCSVGPSCALPPHQPCSPVPTATGAAANADALCAGSGNFCRVSAAGAIGPHCGLDPKRRCRSDADCPASGDVCLTTTASPPLPLSSAGVAVCAASTFSEDVTGTIDVATGDGAVRHRATATTFLGGSVQQPCPVCGGFCSGPAGTTGPGVRALCASDADCAGGSVCVTDHVCSFGPDVDRPCRADPPNGGATASFGNPSRDCRAAGTPIGRLDLLYAPLTTDVATLTANRPCGSPEFAGKTCVGGPREHAPCLEDDECPDGRCNHQCFCAGTQKPNACAPACVGGPDDGRPCTSDADCGAPSLCHPGDCRPNPLHPAGDGLCSVAPADGTCSTHGFVPCAVDADCRPARCPFCGATEVCAVAPRACLETPTLVRRGSPGPMERTSAAVFCLGPTESAAVNGMLGAPGPGAITQAEIVLAVGF